MWTIIDNFWGSIEYGVDLATFLSVVFAIAVFALQCKKDREKTDETALRAGLDKVKERIDKVQDQIKILLTELNAKCKNEDEVKRILGEIHFIFKNIEDNITHDFKYAINNTNLILRNKLNAELEAEFDSFNENINKSKRQLMQMDMGYNKVKNSQQYGQYSKEELLAGIISYLVSREKEDADIIPPLYCMDEMLFIATQ